MWVCVWVSVWACACVGVWECMGVGVSFQVGGVCPSLRMEMQDLTCSSREEMTFTDRHDVVRWGEGEMDGLLRADVVEGAMRSFPQAWAQSKLRWHSSMQGPGRDRRGKARSGRTRNTV